MNFEKPLTIETKNEQELNSEQEKFLSEFVNSELVEILEPHKDLIANIDVMKDEIVGKLTEIMNKKSKIDLSDETDVRFLTEYLSKESKQILNDLIETEAIYNDPKEIYKEFLTEHGLLDIFNNYSNELLKNVGNQKRFLKENEIIKELKGFVDSKKGNFKPEELEEGLTSKADSLFKKAA